MRFLTIMFIVKQNLSSVDGIKERRGQYLLSTSDRIFRTFLCFKGTVHQKIFYRANLIFWIVMGCGTADLGHRGP